MVSHEHRFIFIHIPKTGGTSIETVFYPTYDERRSKLYGLSKYQKDNKCHHKMVHVIQELKPGMVECYYKFVFVRNPWDRAVSSYKHTCRPVRKDLREFLKLGGKFSFKRFVKSLSSCNRPHPHYDSQYSFILDHTGQDCLDYVCRFENFELDFGTVCDTIGIPEHKNKLLHVNKTKHKHYTEYYDDETREIVAERYARDIEYFGYKFGE